MSKAFEYRIEYTIDKKSGRVVATIPELNHVSSYGANFAEAESNVREAALGYLELLTMKNLKAPKPSFSTEGTYLKLLVPQKL